MEVRGSTMYTEEEIKQLVLKGVFSGNSALAPIFCSTKDSDIYFVDSISVTQLSRDTIVISVREKKPVGCIHFLDSYVYFDRTGTFVGGSRNRDEKIPFFNGIEVEKVVEDEKLPVRGSNILSTAVTLATIFQKEEKLPEYVEFDENSQIRLKYEDIIVSLGEDKYLEDKMARADAILKLISGEKGILHLESISDSNKNVTFEPRTGDVTAETWKGGYTADGEFTGDGEYNARGIYVGPRPKTELEYAQEAWPGGYDEEGNYTESGDYDVYGNYVGGWPTQEEIDSHGDWKGGYTEDGSYIGTGEYDHSGNYVGPQPEKNAAEEEAKEEAKEETREENHEEESAGSQSQEESSSYDEDWEEESQDWEDYEEEEEPEEETETGWQEEELEYALQVWEGGYDEEGDYTGAGEYDGYGNYVGPRPTLEDMYDHGSWRGGYNEYGAYDGVGQFDRNGYYMGPNPN